MPKKRLARGRTADIGSERILRELEEIATKMFAERPAWLTREFDREIAGRWERKTRRRVADFDRLASGRNRFMNLVDWVKANFTKGRKTRTVTLRGEECRVWLEDWGEVRGERITPSRHFGAVVKALVELANR